MNATDTKARGTAVPTLRALLAILMLGTLAHPMARAEDVAVSPGGMNLPELAIVITVPDEWDVRDRDGDFFHAATPDKAVWFTATFSLTKLGPKRLAAWLPVHWKRFGIETKVDFSKLQSAKARVGGMRATEYSMEGIFSYAGDIENAQGRMGMSVVDLEVGILIFTWGGEPAKCDEHLDAIVKAMNGLRWKGKAAK